MSANRILGIAFSIGLISVCTGLALFFSTGDRRLTALVPLGFAVAGMGMIVMQNHIQHRFTKRPATITKIEAGDPPRLHLEYSFQGKPFTATLDVETLSRTGDIYPVFIDPNAPTKPRSAAAGPQIFAYAFTGFSFVLALGIASGTFN